MTTRGKPKKTIRGFGAQVAVLIVFGTVSLTTFLYAMVVVLPPAQKLRGGVKTDCNIVKARLACWRRSPFTFTQVERGHHSCWHFDVVKNATIIAAFPVRVQYSPVHAFSEARDTCNSFQGCGNTTWKCTIARSSPNMIRLRWRYPVKKLVLNLTISATCLLLSAVLAYQKFRQSKSSNDTRDDLEEYIDIEGSVDRESIASDGRTIWSAQFNSAKVAPISSDSNVVSNFHPDMTTDEILVRVTSSHAALPFCDNTRTIADENTYLHTVDLDAPSLGGATDVARSR
jgi:hypothetical protein